MNTDSVLSIIVEELNKRLRTVEAAFDSDVILIRAPLLDGLEHKVRGALDSLGAHQPKLTVILDTLGGQVETVERIVTVIRNRYESVWFAIPDKAMSAGTVLALSGNEIFMERDAVLGPIDTQILKTIKGERQLIPAHAYIAQADALLEKAATGSMTEAELAILTTSFDLGELDQFRQLSELGRELVTNYLVEYKFADWSVTESGTPVDQVYRRNRAKEIADELDRYERWHSHSRGIPLKTLTSDAGLRLRIRSLAEEPELALPLHKYYACAVDLAQREQLNSFVHSRAFI